MVIINGRHRWLVTGAAGFIGMHLVQSLLKSGQTVRGVDNFITGHRSRLEYLKKAVAPENWKNFEFVEGDLTDPSTCDQICKNIDFVLHQAALGSVPRSIKDPISTHRHNVDAFLNILFAAKENRIQRFVFASSSSVYGDNPILPKKESDFGKPLSPYAASKQIDEVYALVFQKSYGIQCIGLRYFNVFGPAQDPEGAYAAVIPLWIRALLKGESIFINGDGKISRDFCYVDNVVQANIRAALAAPEATGQVYNIACGNKTDLNELFCVLRDEVAKAQPAAAGLMATHRGPRAGDISHSLADIDNARKNLGYQPSVLAQEGLSRTVAWFSENSFLFK